MMRIIKLAFRNLSRQKKRNVMLAFAICFGFFVVTAIDGLATGAVENLEDQITQMLGGNVIIQGVERLPPVTEGKKGEMISLTRDPDFVRNILNKSGIKYLYYSQRASLQGTLIFGGKKISSLVYGCDFSAEQHLLDSFVVQEGNLKNISKKDAIVLSKKTADNLKIQIGDQMMITADTIKGQKTFADFTVVAIVKDSGLLGSFAAYSNISYIEEMLESPSGSYDTFAITLANKNHQNTAASRMESLIRATGIPVTNRLQARSKNPKSPINALRKQLKNADWKDTMYLVASLEDAVPQLVQVMTVVHTITTIILVVILLIVMVGISNTYRMVMYERIREIGTMRALGMQGKDTGAIFTTEALILCIFGAVAGFVLAIIGMNIFGLFTFNNDMISFFLHKGHFTYHLAVGSYILKLLFMIILTVLAVHGTAKKAANLSPAAALRTIK